MDSTKQIIKKTYDDEAEFYEWRRLSTDLGKYIFKEEKKVILENIGKEVLELGCGTARFSSIVKGKYTGIDFSEKMLEIGKRKNPSLNLIIMDIDDVSKLNKRFDTIFIVRGFKFLNNPKRTLKDCYNLLEEEGKIIIIYSNLNLISWNLLYLANVFRFFRKKSGFFKFYTQGTGKEKKFRWMEMEKRLRETGFKIQSHNGFMNILFFCINFVKTKPSLTKFLIWTNKRYNKGWRSTIVGIKPKGIEK